MSYRSSSLPKCESLAEAIDTFFDRAGLSLPTHVSYMPSFLASTMGSVVLFYFGVQTIQQESLKSKDETGVKKYKWLVLGVVHLLLCIRLQDMVFDRLFLFNNVSINHQHFANVFWLKKYKEAMAS